MKYNSIGEQLIAKAQELDPNYKPDKFNDMSEAIDVILNNAGSEGGDIWLDITPYLSEDMTSISQEGYDLLYNGIMINNKYCGITVGESHVLYYLEYVGNLFFEQINPEENGKSYVFGIYQDLHTVFVENPFIANPSGSSKVWYELPNLFFLENITQEQFDEIKNLALQNQLAGINCGGFYCPLTFYQDEQSISFFFPWYENDIFTPHLIRLDTDLSVKKIPYSTITLPQTAPSSQVIPSITTSGTQENITIGDGLEVKNGALKTTIPPLPSDANTKTYTLKSVNGVLTWSE